MTINNRQRPIAGLSRLAEIKAKEWKTLDAESYPCSIISISKNGAMVKVKFEIEDAQLPEVEMPVFMFNKVRFPIAIGDKGVARASNRYLGGVSGLGGGTANNAIIGNLTGLEFEPISNTEWVQVNTDYLTILTDISDNFYRTNLSRIYNNSSIIIDKINQLIGALNTTNAVVNSHVGSELITTYPKLPKIETNLAEPNE